MNLRERIGLIRAALSPAKVAETPQQPAGRSVTPLVSPNGRANLPPKVKTRNAVIRAPSHEQPNMARGLSDRSIEPTVGEWVQILPKIPPEQIRAWMLSSSQGNFYSGYSLFSVMEETWPRLRKNLHEIREAVSRVKYKVTPFAVEGEEPTDEAVEKAHEFKKALRCFDPAPASDERDFEGTVYDVTNALVMGVAAQEILWQNVDGMWCPRATAFVFPPRIGFTQDRQLGVNGILEQSDYWTGATAQALDPDKFLVGQYQTRSGPCTTFGLLRPLAWWWGAGQYGRDWLMKYAQIFGQPIRWATYDRKASPATIAKVEALLRDMGAAAYAAFPEGTLLQLMKANETTSSNPQIVLMEMADKFADLTILGQTLTSDVRDSGSRALGDVHADTKNERVLGLAQWCANNPLEQLARAWARLNYGSIDECPIVTADTTVPETPMQVARRMSIILSSGIPLPKTWTYEQLGVPVPEDGEDTISVQRQPEQPQGFDEFGNPLRERTSEAFGQGRRERNEEIEVEDTEGEEGFAEASEAEVLERIEAACYLDENGKRVGAKLKPLKSKAVVSTSRRNVASLMIEAARGNGDKHNRIYRFESIPMKAAQQGDTARSVKAIIEKDGKVLVLKDARSDWWDLPGGHVRDGEQWRDALKREVKEETGMDIVGVAKSTVASEDMILGRERTHVAFYDVSADGGIELSSEHSDFKWADASDIIRLNLGVFKPILLSQSVAASRGGGSDRLVPFTDRSTVAAAELGVDDDNARATTEDFLSSLAKANEPLSKRLASLRSAPDDKFADGLRAILDDFPDIARECLDNEDIGKAADALESGMAAEIADAMAEASNKRKRAQA